MHKEKFSFMTATGKTEGTEYVLFDIEGIEIKCYLYNFHKRFHILLGTPALEELNAQINFNYKTIKIQNKLIKLQYYNATKENNLMDNDEIKIRTDHLNSEEKRELIKIIQEYHEIFPKENTPLSHTSTIKHVIHSKNNIPVYSKNYRYPECYKKEINNQVEKLLNDKIIQ